jgi:hypothetical protein
LTSTLSEDDRAAIDRVVSLARVFPESIAVALESQAHSGLEQLRSWSPRKFRVVLEEAGVDAAAVAQQSERFLRLRRLLADGRRRWNRRGAPLASAVSGILVDTSLAAGWTKEELRLLDAASVETLRDWARLREQLDIAPDHAKLLDDMARLEALGLSGELAQGLLQHRIGSAYDLVHLSQDEARNMARSLGVEEQAFAAIRQQAMASLGVVGRMIEETKIYLDGPNLDELEVPDPLVDVFERPNCKDCPEDFSALSRFAYFVYLIRKTGKTLAELEAELHQRFSSLTPESGNEELPQIELCVAILTGALPRALSDDEQMKHRRFWVAQTLHRPPMRLHDVALKVHDADPSIGIESVESKLRQLLAASPDSDTPSFTITELDTIVTAVDELLFASVVTQVKADPRFADSSEEAIHDEAVIRVIRATDPIRIAALPFLRDAYRTALNKTDAQLFSSLFVETNLGVCDRTTQLDQAIRSLQAYLDHTKAMVEAAGEPGELFGYLGFEAWRGEESARLFPELKALWQDDVLTFEGEPGVRGSIILNHVVNEPRLASAIQTAAQIVTNCQAVVQGGNNADAVPFRSTYATFYSDFERGFDVLDSVLDANRQAQEAVRDLDAYEPRLALSHLSNAADKLAHVADLVFAATSDWRGPEAGLALYDRIAALPITSRKELLQGLFDELKDCPKAVFVPQNASFVVAGLLPNGHFQSIADWQINEAYSLRADGSIHKRSVGGSSPKQARYKGSGSSGLTNYSVSVDCSLRQELLDGDRFGLALRSNPAGGKGYRLLIEREITSTDPDEGEFFDETSDFFLGEDQEFIENTYLRLLHEDGSSSAELEKQKILRSGVNEIGVDLLPIGDTFTLSFQAHGNTLTGVLTLGADEFRVSANDSSRQNGTFALLASAGVDVDFSNMHVEVEGDAGRPPFYASRRATNGQSVTMTHYGKHQMGYGMAQPLTGKGVTYTAAADTRVKMEGAKVEKQLQLLFKEGEQAVDLDRLDSLLERLLSALFYLRYAVIPVRLASAYRLAGDYVRAASMLRIVYDDDGLDEAQREIYPMLTAAPEAFVQTIGADSRLMRLRLGETYLALAEWYFRQNTETSRYSARRCYERVLRLHAYVDTCECDDQIGQIVETIARFRFTDLEDAAQWFSDYHAIISSLTASNSPVSANVVHAALPTSREPRSLATVRSRIQTVLDHKTAKVRSDATLAELAKAGEQLLKKAELSAFARRDFAGRPLADGNVSVGSTRPPSPYTIDYTFCVPGNGVKSYQKRLACQMLELLRNCRNILGFGPDLVPPLRFEALLQLASSFAQLAQAAERDLLNFRQQFEQETFSLLDAENQLAQGEAELALQTLNVLQAEGDVRIAELQFEQVNASVTYFEGLVSEGLIGSERLALDSANAAAALSVLASVPALAGIGLAIGGVAAAPATGGAGAALAGAATIATALTGGLSSVATAASAVSSAAALQAGFERRAQEWSHELSQAQFGSAIAQQNLIQSALRHSAALQTQQIAALRRDFAANAVQYLGNKFLNAEMWLVLQQVIREQYRMRLNYAITAAYMAERALAFEIQNPSLRVVRFDYYDRRRDGLLGATELQTDLATLQNTRLSFAHRKLQLSKTISLAQTLPVEFAIFRHGFTLASGERQPAGRLVFGTQMEWFDREFPGHYMRLIKAIRMTVVALIPPNEGIRATLRNSGISLVVAGPPYIGSFEQQTISRPAESVALSVPFQASGLFVLDYNDDMLLPFEGTGVATDWVFELPQTANRFDFDSIADVLLTIEYTALESPVYREQVLQSLDPMIVLERAFSFRQNFADAWYDLNNPRLQEPDRQMIASFETERGDFAPNAESLSIRHVTLFFVREDAAAQEVKVDHLHFIAADLTAGAALTGGPAETVDGFISTRRSDTHPWIAMQGHDPIGQWELKLPNEDAVKERFSSGEITDIILVVAYSGIAPSWP